MSSQSTDMHRVVEAALTVEQTHPRLGRLYAACLIAARAHICILPIAPAGCGKSVVSRSLYQSIKPSMRFDSITRSGLVKLQDEFTGYSGLLVVDDLGKIDTAYGRTGTVTTMCELVYSHFVTKHSGRDAIVVENFNGSAILNCQPVVFRWVVLGDEWDATIADKTLRYYHFYRPEAPTEDELPDMQFQDIAIADVEPPKTSSKEYAVLRELGQVQWSRARVDEHWSKLLRAVAALDGRKAVTREDMIIANTIFRPMFTERHLMRRRALESERDFDNDLLCFFVEWASHGPFTIDDIMEDYHVSQSTAYAILNKYQRYWQPVGDKPKRFAPSSLPLNSGTDRTMYDVLAECGIEFQPID